MLLSRDSVCHGAVVPGQRSEVGLCVVIVDDNPNTVKLLGHLFREAGWKVFGYTSPLSAITDMVNYEPDMVLTDFRMPEMYGPEFLLQVDRIHEAVPKLIMTAYDDDNYIRDQLRKAGIPSISKGKGLTEVVEFARGLVSVRLALKRRGYKSRVA